LTGLFGFNPLRGASFFRCHIPTFTPEGGCCFRGFIWEPGKNPVDPVDPVDPVGKKIKRIHSIFVL
jgi:hypothetical protein